MSPVALWHHKFYDQFHFQKSDVNTFNKKYVNRATPN